MSFHSTYRSAGVHSRELFMKELKFPSCAWGVSLRWWGFLETAEGVFQCRASMIIGSALPLVLISSWWGLSSGISLSFPLPCNGIFTSSDSDELSSPSLLNDRCVVTSLFGVLNKGCSQSLGFPSSSMISSISLREYYLPWLILSAGLLLPYARCDWSAICDGLGIMI